MVCSIVYSSPLYKPSFKLTETIKCFNRLVNSSWLGSDFQNRPDIWKLSFRPPLTDFDILCIKIILCAEVRYSDFAYKDRTKSGTFWNYHLSFEKCLGLLYRVFHATGLAFNWVDWINICTKLEVAIELHTQIFEFSI